MFIMDAFMRDETELGSRPCQSEIHSFQNPGMFQLRLFHRLLALDVFSPDLIGCIWVSTQVLACLTASTGWRQRRHPGRRKQQNKSRT